MSGTHPDAYGKADANLEWIHFGDKHSRTLRISTSALKWSELKAVSNECNRKEGNHSDGQTISNRYSAVPQCPLASPKTEGTVKARGLC